MYDLIILPVNLTIVSFKGHYHQPEVLMSTEITDDNFAKTFRLPGGVRPNLFVEVNFNFWNFFIFEII